MTKCYFCDLKQKKYRMMWENTFFYAVFDSNPVSPGHATIVTQRHIQNILELQQKEWVDLKKAIQKTIECIEKTDVSPVYQALLKENESSTSASFCEKALAHPGLNTKPDAYNQGVNEGKAAGRTVEHFHWHIIPRYAGDMDGSSGGLRFVIPHMGLYH